ncbi:hypothetical protein D3C85_457110 [compost metagenome]
MAIYKQTFPQIVESINRLNGLNLTVEQYLFGPPTPVDPLDLTDLTLAQKAIDEKINTSMLITAKDQYSLYQGSVTVYYHRMDLQELIRQTPLMADVMEANTTMDVVAALNKKYGLILTADDIVTRPLTTEEKDLDNPINVTIEAMPLSQGWVGSVEVGMRRGGYQLKDYITDLTVSAFDYPATYSSKPFAAVYSYWRDFSTQYDKLITVEVGTTQIEAVRLALVAITGNAWTMTANQRYSLAGATVTAVGETIEHEADYNIQYDRFVRVALDPVKCLGYIGDLYFHFNVPLEP